MRKPAGIDFVELQVCTLFQHAWAEADHDVGYKPSRKLTPEEQGLKAFCSRIRLGR